MLWRNYIFCEVQGAVGRESNQELCGAVVRQETLRWEGGKGLLGQKNQRF